MLRLIYAVAASLLALALPLTASSEELSAGSKALEQANAGMHHAMSIEMTGDVDVDFMRAMIPHHQGAIDMAKIGIAYGKDPDTRKQAEEIIKAQEAEIAFMEEWLKRNAGGEADTGEGADHGAH